MIVDFIVRSFKRLNCILAIDSVEVGDVESASFAFYVDTEINVGDSLTLGLAVPNNSPEGSWWEVFLNDPAMEEDLSLFRYAVLHETGHLLGLEHPFDSSDGDQFVSSDPLTSSAYPEETVMAYRDPISSDWPVWYSPSDIDAFVSAWGRREFDSSGVIFSSHLASMSLLIQPVDSTLTPLESDQSFVAIYRERSNLLQSSDRFISLSPSSPTLFDLTDGERWGIGFSARNFGSPNSPGTGQIVSVEGLLRNQVAFDIDSQESVGISMPVRFNSTLFADDMLFHPWL